MALSEIETVEIGVIKFFILGLILTAVFMGSMILIPHCSRCNCYTVPVLSEYLSDEGYTGATKYQMVECSSCRDKAISREKEYRERKW